jgi:hypothetical protein
MASLELSRTRGGYSLLEAVPVKATPKLNVGEVLVDLRKLKRKYQELERNRQAFRSSVLHQKPGNYDTYKVVQVREVEVKAHFRRSHKRILIVNKP